MGVETKPLGKSMLEELANDVEDFMWDESKHDSGFASIEQVSDFIRDWNPRAKENNNAILDNCKRD